nr:co-chaperone [Cryptococcus depauperatus CBS 7855]
MPVKADDSAGTLRQLKIKTGVVKRLHKEESVYQQEVKAQVAIVEKLKRDGADGADIRAAERVLKESEKMIPITRDSLQEAHQVLKDLNAVKTDEEISCSQEFGDAFSILQQVEADWKNGGN